MHANYFNTKIDTIMTGGFIVWWPGILVPNAEQYYRPITLNERYKITLLPSKTMIKVKELLCSIFSKLKEVGKMIVISSFSISKGFNRKWNFNSRDTNKKESVAWISFFQPEKILQIAPCYVVSKWRNDSSGFGCESSSRCTTRRSNLTQLSPTAVSKTRQQLISNAWINWH